jgi:hypothetical protein
MEQDLPDRGRVVDGGDESDVAATGGAREREVLRDLHDERGPHDSGRVVGARPFAVPGTLRLALSQREREREGRHDVSLRCSSRLATGSG